MSLGSVAGICVMILLGYGLEKLRFPETDNSLFTFLKGYPPLVMGSVSVSVALAILWISMHRWAKFLSGLFAYAVFGGLLAVAGGGFHSNIPSLRLTRLEAAGVTALYAACTILTSRLRSGDLNWADRVAVLSAPILLTWTATSSEAGTGFKMLGAMAVLFAVAGVYSHLSSRHPSSITNRKSKI